MWSNEEIEDGCREFLKQERNLIPLAKEFLRCCIATGLNPKYDGVVAYPSAGRLVFIVEHDTMIQRASRTGELKGMESGTRIREDGGVIAWAKVYRGEGRDMFAAAVDVAQWQAAHPRSPFWKSRPQSMAEKCARVMAVKLAFAAEFQGLRDDVTSVLYDPDKPKAESKPKAQAKPKPKPEPKSRSFSPPSQRKTPESFFADVEAKGHRLEEVCRRLNLAKGEGYNQHYLSDGEETFISRLIHQDGGLCTEQQYLLAIATYNRLTDEYGASSAKERLMRVGKRSHVAYLSADMADRFAAQV